MKILGISAYYHDSAAALLVDGQVVAAAQEERFTRKKHDAGFPGEAVDHCLKAAGLGLGEVDYVAFYDKPFVKFERLVETYLATAPHGYASFARAMPLWLKEKLFQKNLITRRLKAKLPGFDEQKAALLGASPLPRGQRLLPLSFRRRGGTHLGWRW